MRSKKKIKKLTIDLNSEQISEKIKTKIVELTEIIKRQKEEISALREENEELKKNFI